MIPKDYITEWRSNAPWPTDWQVEQDLAISRAIVALYSRAAIAESVAFRGGTALYKLFLRPAARYSEDIDLVQTMPGSIGSLLDEIHAALDHWLGKPQWKQTDGRVTLAYRFEADGAPPIRLKLKIEINTREHFTVFGLRRESFRVNSRWFSGAADVSTYELDELLGTKMRALYQRKKGRDLFDLAFALRSEKLQPSRIIEAFARYTQADGVHITRAMFEQNLAQKKTDPQFNADIGPLLSRPETWDFDAALELVLRELVERMPGDPWKGP